MPTLAWAPALPVAATIDLQYRLPPFRQIFFTPTILISLVVFAIAAVVVYYLSRRAKIRAREDARRDSFRLVERILVKRNGTDEDVNRILSALAANPKIDPSTIVVDRERFQAELKPIITAQHGEKFGERMEKIFFPPPKDTRAALAAHRDVKSAVEETKSTAAGQNTAAILDLMDATLRPGVVTRLVFDGVEGGHECLVMGYDMQTINLTLPAHNDQLVAALRPGMKVEGTLENGPSLMAFTASMIQAVAGSMPYCRITVWSSAWEVRKRDAVRLPLALDVDFQHISTAAAESIKMASLDREIGSLRPGKLIDVSLGGCCLETPSTAGFAIGDMIRFSKSLVPSTPPAALLGSVVNIDQLDPATNDGACQRLHVQFLVIDDVSQRILVRTLRQLQDVMDRDEWMHAQQLLQKMRRNRIVPTGAAGGGGGGSGTRTGTRAGSRVIASAGTSARPRPGATGGGSSVRIRPGATGAGTGNSSVRIRPGVTSSRPNPDAARPTPGRPTTVRPRNDTRGPAEK